MTPRRLSPRLRLGLAVILGLLLFEFALAPLFRWQEETTARVQRLQEAVARKQSLLGRDEDLRVAAGQAAALLQDLSGHYPPADDPKALQLALQQRLETLAGELDFQVQSSDWLPATSGGLVRAPVSFRLQIVPDALIRLLYALEGDRNFMSVDRLQITARSTQELLTAVLDVSAYGRPGPEERPE